MFGDIGIELKEMDKTLPPAFNPDLQEKGSKGTVLELVYKAMVKQRIDNENEAAKLKKKMKQEKQMEKMESSNNKS